MKKAITYFLALFALSLSPASFSLPIIDYSKMVILDAEDLAETGIKDAYGKLKPQLKRYVKKPAQIIESFNDNIPSYSVSSDGRTYDIYAPNLVDGRGESWGRATAALFTIVNRQLKHAHVKFYAINSGNDLGGVFLTKRQVAEAKKSLTRKTDWPYLPTWEDPWYGQPH